MRWSDRQRPDITRGGRQSHNVQNTQKYHRIRFVVVNSGA